MALNRLLVTAIAVTACTPSRPPPTKPVVAPKIKLAILAVESDRFPRVAEVVASSLASAHITGVDETEVAKVSLEVVQLSIECVEPTPACYAAVGKSLAANRLLFAQVVAGKRRDVQVTVTLFDVDGGAPKSAQKLFPNEREATAGIEMLVAEATR